MSTPVLLMSQTNPSQAERWLANAQLPPPFVAPRSKPEWEAGRQEIRAMLWQLLGKLPARPKVASVQTISRDDRGDFVVEKFSFDNGAGATVPGYLLLPKQPVG